MFSINEVSNYLIVSLLSVLFIILVNTYLSSSKMKIAFNFIFFSESIVLTFFFAKFPLFLSLPIVIVTSYYLIFGLNSNEIIWSNPEEELFSKDINSKFPILGYVLIFLIVVYEYNADKTISSSGLLVLFLSVLLVGFNRIPLAYYKERDFLLIFFSLLVLWYVIPMVIYKIKYGYIGIKTEGSGFIDNEFIVSILLAKPLATILTLMGYDLFLNGQYIHINDLSTNSIMIVSIAESCSGIYSVLLFLCALLSYLLVEFRNIRISTMGIILSLGLLTAYMSNMFRMIVVILSGHYRGSDALLFVHSHIGWIIFTIWIFIFWYFLEKLLPSYTSSESSKIEI